MGEEAACTATDLSREDPTPCRDVGSCGYGFHCAIHPGHSVEPIVKILGWHFKHERLGSLHMWSISRKARILEITVRLGLRLRMGSFFQCTRSVSFLGLKLGWVRIRYFGEWKEIDDRPAPRIVDGRIVKMSVIKR